ncbi:MAG: hypothetical protein GC131_09650, partial [Alphaproteobacteria bacterium]|nr:hypothetical protein [Alphaproteobacteria bacterium]
MAKPIYEMTQEEIAALTSPEIAAIPSGDLCRTSHTLLQLFTAEQMSALTASQLDAIALHSTSTGPSVFKINHFKPEQIAQIKPEVIGK